MKAVSSVLAVIASMLVAASLLAADAEKPQHGKHQRHGATGDGMQWLDSLKLTDEQKAKVDEVKKEFAPKMEAATKKMQEVLTEDQKKARDEGMKAAREAGKTGRDVWQAGLAATKLTDEQKTKMAEATKEMTSVTTERREKIMAILTPEQQEEAKKKLEQFTGRKGGGHKAEK
jgi:Spy/CpxP family protein refolding chaperone